MEFPTRSAEAENPIDGSIHKPYEMIRLLTRNEGLKSFTERLRYARKLSQRSEQPLTWDHFVEAHTRIHDNAIPPKQWN